MFVIGLLWSGRRAEARDARALECVRRETARGRGAQEERVPGLTAVGAGDEKPAAGKPAPRDRRRAGIKQIIFGERGIR